MMALDSNGNTVQFGDYIIVQDQRVEPTATFVSTIVRIIKIEEGTGGVKATGACVVLEGHGRVAKFPVDLAQATLVMKSSGEVV